MPGVLFLMALSLSSQHTPDASQACVVPKIHCCQFAVVPLEMPKPIKLKLSSHPQRTNQGSLGLTLGASQAPVPHRSTQMKSRIAIAFVKRKAFYRHGLIDYAWQDYNHFLNWEAGN